MEDVSVIALAVAWLFLSYGVMIFAHRKGRNQIAFFVLAPLLSPLVGFVLVAAGPSNPQKRGLRKCPECAEWVKPEALKCRFCGFDLRATSASSRSEVASKPGARW